MGRVGLVVLVLAVSLVLGATQWTRAQLEPADPDAGETVAFRVARGEGLAGVTRRLEDAGLIRNARIAFRIGRFDGIAERLRAGDYELSASTPTRDVLEQLTTGRRITYSLVIPEGFTGALIAERVEQEGLGEKAAFLAAIDDPGFARELGVPAKRLEGYLYPETYRLPKGLGAKEIIRILVEEHRSVWAELEPRATAQGLEHHQVVTLASIVEKETGAAHERPLIASVFWNRLQRGMRLESDPTTIYGIPNFDGNLRRKHLEDPTNPYNTYQIPALPPGPIASPGRAALTAIVEPDSSDFLFFVSRNDGTHVFSKTYREHVNAVNEYQRKRRSK